MGLPEEGPPGEEDRRRAMMEIREGLRERREAELEADFNRRKSEIMATLDQVEDELKIAEQSENYRCREEFREQRCAFLRRLIASVQELDELMAEVGGAHHTHRVAYIASRREELTGLETSVAG